MRIDAHHRLRNLSALDEPSLMAKGIARFYRHGVYPSRNSQAPICTDLIGA